MNSDEEVSRGNDAVAVKTQRPTPCFRWKRLLFAIVSPKAWGHLLKLLNFYNYSHVRPLGKMKMGSDSHVSPTATFSHGERIRLGSRVLVGEGSRLWAGPSKARIEIGDDTLLGPGVIVTAASYDYKAGRPVADQFMLEEDVTIGRDVWIGAGAAILKGSRIGDGAIIGANAVVTGEIPSEAIAVGAPARVVGTRFGDDQKTAAG